MNADLFGGRHKVFLCPSPGWGRGWGRQSGHIEANLYMRWARIEDQNDAAGVEMPFTSLREMSGATDRDRERRQSAQHQAFRRVLHARRLRAGAKRRAGLHAVGP